MVVQPQVLSSGSILTLGLDLDTRNLVRESAPGASVHNVDTLRALRLELYFVSQAETTIPPALLVLGEKIEELPTLTVIQRMESVIAAALVPILLILDRNMGHDSSVPCLNRDTMRRLGVRRILLRPLAREELAFQIDTLIGLERPIRQVDSCMFTESGSCRAEEDRTAIGTKKVASRGHAVGPWEGSHAHTLERSHEGARAGVGCAWDPQTEELRVAVLSDDDRTVSALRSILKPHCIDAIRLETSGALWKRSSGTIPALEAAAPDMLILDADISVGRNVPWRNNCERICRIIRSNSRWKCLPILLLTPDHSDASVDVASYVGADDYVCKPLVGPELVARAQNRLESLYLRRAFVSQYNFVAADRL
ncbi:MAG: hypothetical protein NVSMB52_17240 [Chloroflexota bacterium]